MPSINQGPSSSSTENVSALIGAPASSATPEALADLQQQFLPPSVVLKGTATARMISFGDSLSLASSALGTTTIANMYMRKLANYLGLGGTDANGGGAPNGTTFVESAISGIASARYINALNRNLQLSASDLVCGIPMFNTMRTLAPDPTFLHELLLSIEGIFSWFAVPESKKVRAITVNTTTPNTAVATSGTWAYFAATAGTDLNGLDLRGTTASATATFPVVTGDTVYIWYLRSTLAEAFTVSVDGVAYNVGGAIAYTTWLSGINSWELCVLRVTGLAKGPHTVVATRSPANVNIVAVAGFDSATIRESCPAVLLTDCPPMITGVAAQGYAFAGGVANDPLSALQAASASGTLNGTINIPYTYGHAGVATYNTLIQQVARNLQRDGLRIGLVEAGRNLMPTNDVSGDFVHFNDGGNEKIFRSIKSELDVAFGI